MGSAMMVIPDPMSSLLVVLKNQMQKSQYFAKGLSSPSR